MKILFAVAMMMLFVITGCQRANSSQQAVNDNMTIDDKRLRVATFAGGCFWCTESDFEKVPGVVKAVSGYTGGKKENPTYEEVSSGTTGHIEAVQVYYDPAKVIYEELLDYFWRHVDPTDSGGQFVDRGSQYRSVISYHDEEQKRLAEKSKEELNKSGRFDKPIVTEIIKFVKPFKLEFPYRLKSGFIGIIQLFPSLFCHENSIHFRESFPGDCRSYQILDRDLFNLSNLVDFHSKNILIGSDLD